MKQVITYIQNNYSTEPKLINIMVWSPFNGTIQQTAVLQVNGELFFW